MHCRKSQSVWSMEVSKIKNLTVTIYTVFLSEPAFAGFFLQLFHINFFDDKIIIK